MTLKSLRVFGGHGVMSDLTESLLDFHTFFVGAVPSWFVVVVNVFLLGAGIALASLFIWKFYDSLSRRDLIRLHLRQYNTSEHPGLHRFFAALLYLIEYIIILPFLVFLWFAGLSFILYLLSEQRDVQQVLTTTTAVVIAVRLLAYQGGGVAKDLAKMFPFTALSLFLLTDVSLSVESVLVQAGAIGELFIPLLSFLGVIVVVELLLRVLTTISMAVRGVDTEDDDPGEKD